MTDHEFYVKTGSGTLAYGKSWIPDKLPLAVLAVIHGFGDHIGRYDDFAGYFTANGIAITGLDLPGHGRSSGKRGHIRSLSDILNHVQQLILETRRRFIEVPIILFGQSMGGNFIFNYALRHTSREIRGVILSSPWIRTTKFFNHRPDFFNRMIGRLHPALLLTMDLDPMELSHDPLVGKNYLVDPIKHNKISMQLFRELHGSSLWILENARRLSYPVLIMHGNQDRITSCEASADLAQNIKGEATLKIWDGMRHELHHETTKETVFQYLFSWIVKILGDSQ